MRGVMSNPSEILSLLEQAFSTIEWRDSLEILIFSSSIYYFLLWLKKDTQKNLTFTFYLYCTLLLGAYYAELPMLHSFLLSSAPLVLMLFIVLHQETLQRNFIMFKRPATQNSLELSWTDELIRSCLTALNNKKELLVLIERNDSLKNLLYAPCLFHADLKKDIFDILAEKHTPTNDYMVWVTHEGKLVAINTSWRINVDEEWVTEEAAALHKWKQDSIFISSKTDALIFKVKPLTRTFDLIMQGKLAEDLSSEQLLAILQRKSTKSRHPAREVSVIPTSTKATPEKTL
jgi:DNA integrity scanning protein DisA with diadenylate cyclase activity